LIKIGICEQLLLAEVGREGEFSFKKRKNADRRGENEKKEEKSPWQNMHGAS